MFGVLQSGQVTPNFVSGILTEGSVTLETLKVFMQFVLSWNRFAVRSVYCEDRWRRQSLVLPDGWGKSTAHGEVSARPGEAV